MKRLQALPKHYTPSQVESTWYEYWQEQGYFRSEPDEREPYTVVIPPPNVTGVLHMGHMLNNTLQDVLIRRKRMEGYNACWVPGTDHASIATEAKVVKMLREEKGIEKGELTREQFLQYAYEWKNKYGGIILEQLKQLGASCDWSRTRFTMDESYYRQVIQVFVDLYNKGYIYRGYRMVNWDPVGQTALSDEEVNHSEIEGQLYHVRYPLADDPQQYLVIATTRPETIMADTAVAVNPEDERYRHLIGKEVVVPVVERRVPVIADAYVDMSFGTGALKVTPAHDENDYGIGLRHELPIVDAINFDGTMSEHAGPYAGQDRNAVRQRMGEDLQQAGLLEKLEAYTHSVGFSERTDAMIEPKLSVQWFLAMEELVKPALRAVIEPGDDGIQLIPQRFVNSYRHWMENIRDWCISRQLWWGQRIPAYYLPDGDYVVAETPEAALEQARAKGFQGSLEELQQDPDVLDTWFSSWLWPIAVFDGILAPDNAEITYYYPTNDLVTAPDILFFWVARMIVAGYEYRGERPFSTVYLTSVIRDNQRRKMSKSLGNSPDVIRLMNDYGADAVRMGMLLGTSAGNDLLFDESLCEQGRNFANKIWNALRLVKSWEERQENRQPGAQEKLAADWFRARLDHAGANLAQYFRQYRTMDIALTLYKLIWEDFCAWYLEAVKPGPEEAISATTYEQTLTFFEELMQLLHPYMPFITEEVWHQLRERPDADCVCVAHLTTYETAPEDQQLLDEMQEVQQLIRELRAFRSDKNLANRHALALEVRSSKPDLIQRFAPLIEDAANLQGIAFVAERPRNAHVVVSGVHELFIDAEAVGIDPTEERERIQTEIDYLRGFLQKVEQKLNNERFINNAPAEVVEKERQKQRDTQERLRVLENSLAQLQA